MYTPEFIAKMRRFMELREARDAANKAAEAAERDYREIETEVHAELQPDDDAENMKVGAIKIPLGAPYGVVTFEARETTYGRIVDSEALEEWYENRAMMDEVSEPKFVMARINEEVRTAEENGTPLPPGTDFYKRRFVSVRRPKT